MIYKGNGRYIHNFWKLGGATRIYDGNRAGDALKNHRGKLLPYDLRWGNVLGEMGKGGWEKPNFGGQIKGGPKYATYFYAADAKYATYFGSKYATYFYAADTKYATYFSTELKFKFLPQPEIQGVSR